MNHMKWASWINFILGLWLIVSAFVVSQSHNPAMSQELVFGIVIAGLALSAATAPVASVIGWFVALSGLWTVIAPFALRYSRPMIASTTNDVIVGLIVLVLGVVSAVPSGSKLPA